MKEKEAIKNQLSNMALANAKARQKVYETELGIVLKLHSPGVMVTPHAGHAGVSHDLQACILLKDAG